MNLRKWIIENTTMMTLLMIAIGIILILSAQWLDLGILRSLLESFGILFTSIFFISFLYEKFIAEKHFEQFRVLIRSQLESMDSVQSMCARLGIREIFESRNDFEAKYPLFALFSKTKPNSRILAIGRSMFFFFNRGDAIKSALQNGSNMQIACISPTEISDVLMKVCYLWDSDIQSALHGVNELLQWIEDKKPPGTFELRVHKAPLPDSILYTESGNEKLMAWDMTFGRDTNQKRIFVIEPGEGNIGDDLLKRYEAVWSLGEVYIKVESGGRITVNKLQELMEKKRGQ